MLDVEPEHKFLNKTIIAISVYLESKLDYTLCFCSIWLSVIHWEDVER